MECKYSLKHEKKWYDFVKVAVDNFCKQASKLALAVAWDSLGS